MGSGSQQTTTTTSSAPPEFAQPYIEQGLSDASALAQSGNLFQPMTISTVVPNSTQTQGALDYTQNLAQTNMGPGGLGGQAQNIINAGGMNAPQQASMDYLNNIGSNPFDLSQNQAYQSYRQNMLGDIGDQVNAAASMAGRYGSGMHTDRLASSLANAGAQMDLSQMQRMDALNSERFNAGQTAFGNLGQAYGLAGMPAASLMGVGANYEDLYGRTTNDQIRIAQEIANQPRLVAEWQNAIYNGAGTLGGQSQSTAQMPGQNPLLTGLGYATGGLGLLGSFGGGGGWF